MDCMMSLIGVNCHSYCIETCAKGKKKLDQANEKDPRKLKTKMKLVMAKHYTLFMK